MTGRSYTRAGILKLIDSRGVVKLQEIKERFGIDAKTAHNHIAKLSKYLMKEGYGRYTLTHMGKALIGRHGGDEESIYNFLLKEHKLTKPKPKKGRAVIDIMSYRNHYDLMASILELGDSITISRVFRGIGIPSGRSAKILAFMQKKGLIEKQDVRTGKVLRKQFRATEKGLQYLEKYSEMVKVIK